MIMVWMANRLSEETGLQYGAVPLDISRTAKRRNNTCGRRTYWLGATGLYLMYTALVFWRNHDDASLSGYEEGRY